MSIESDLRKDGIEVIDKLHTLAVNSIAKNIAEKIIKTFPEYNLDTTELFIKLSRINMYRAKIPEGLAEANYFYKNTSIYFNEQIPFEDLEEFAIHECIHYLQEVKDKKNELLRMGLCNFADVKITGLGLNEAAVQLMTSKIIGIPHEYVKYFNVEFSSASPSYYPLECHLVQEMAYFTGEDVLFESTLNSNDNFKNTFINLTSEKTFLAIQSAIDTILEIEENIIKLNTEFQAIDEKNKKGDNIVKKIENYKNKITITFLRTQNLIISSYFDTQFTKITNLEELDIYRKKLCNFKKLIGTSDGYTFYDDYYTEKMSALEHKCNIYENGGIETALAIKKQSKISSIFRAIKNFFFRGNVNEKNDIL